MSFFIPVVHSPLGAVGQQTPWEAVLEVRKCPPSKLKKHQRHALWEAVPKVWGRPQSILKNVDVGPLRRR
jgi:hypothetical protein